jgi:ferredoxin-NADP reductase
MKLTLVKKSDDAKGTKSFFWQTEHEVKYLPGQYFYYTLPELKYPDPRGPTRHFTISSSPSEGSLLRLTTRIRVDSGYKKTLDELKIGQNIEGEGPNGTFILDEHEKGNHILIAGGIGITPFRSIIKYNIDKQNSSEKVFKNLSQTKLYLIYSNSLPEEIAFRKELEEWTFDYPNFRTAFTVSKTESGKSTWNGLRGRIDEIMLNKLIKDWKLKIGNTTFWLCGPPPMVEALEKTLGKLKITSDKLISEKFTGY